MKPTDAPGDRARSGSLERAYRAMLERSGDMVLLSDWKTARFVEANQAALDGLGYALAELRTMTGGDLSEFPREVHQRLSQELIDHGRTMASAIPVRCRDGRLITADLWVERLDADEPLHVTVLRPLATAPSVVPDPQRLQESEAFYRGVVTYTGDAVVVTEAASGEVVEANPAACTLFGRTTVEWRGITRASLCPDDGTLAELERELARTGRAKRSEVPLRRADGRAFYADLTHNDFESAGRTLVVTLIRDVSARMKERERFERAQRLAAVGEVAAGVAHEINNPAAFAILNSEVVTEQLRLIQALAADGELPEVRLRAALSLALEAVEDTQDGLRRVASAARELRRFWRVDEPHIAELDVNEVVRATLTRLQNELRHRAVVQLGLTAPSPRVIMQTGKLEQVLTNVVINAAQAIVEGDAEANLVQVETARVEDRVFICVTDTGQGMDAATLERVFEPFFTTKPGDQGTGLGLSLSAEIVQAHGGRIALTSTPGVGTCVRIELPVDTGLRANEDEPEPTRTGRRVLIVDDDPGMVRAYRRVLRRRPVMVADSGRKALALLEADPDFDLILCDLMMPDVDGPAVFRALHERDPELAAKLVFCTGGAITPRMRAFVEAVDNPVLNKPLSAMQLQALFEPEEAADR